MERRCYYYRGVPLEASANFPSFLANYGSLQDFEKLQKMTKDNNNAVRILENIFKQRIDAEKEYARNLGEVSARLSIATETLGTTSWTMIVSAIDTEAKIHQEIASALLEQICTALSEFSKEYLEKRKIAEEKVSKAIKYLEFIRNEEREAKEKAFKTTSEFEKLQSQVKITHETSSKTKKHEEDVENFIKTFSKKQYDLTKNAERMRDEIQVSIIKICADSDLFEKKRQAKLNSAVKSLKAILLDSTTKQMDNVEAVKLYDTAMTDDISSHLLHGGKVTVLEVEQNLVDFYAENSQLPMSLQRRENFLKEFHDIIVRDLEQEVAKRKEFEISLTESQGRRRDKNFAEEIAKSKSMIDFFEACHYKISKALGLNLKITVPCFPLVSQLRTEIEPEWKMSSILVQPLELSLSSEDRKNVSHTDDRFFSDRSISTHRSFRCPFDSSAVPLSFGRAFKEISLESPILRESVRAVVVTNPECVNCLTSFPPVENCSTSLPWPPPKEGHEGCPQSQINYNIYGTLTNLPPEGYMSPISEHLNVSPHKTCDIPSFRRPASPLQESFGSSIQQELVFLPVPGRESRQGPCPSSEEMIVHPNKEMLKTPSKSRSTYGHQPDSSLSSSKDRFWCSSHKPFCSFSQGATESHNHRSSENSSSNRISALCSVDLPFEARNAKELNVCPGDRIKLIECSNSNWWIGELHGQIGLFPSSVVKELKLGCF